MKINPEEQYSEAEASRLCTLSASAYKSEVWGVHDCKQLLSADDARLIDGGSCEVLAMKRGPDVWLAFRGTEGNINLSGWSGVWDLWRDGRVYLRRRMAIPGRVHAGFSAGVLEVQFQLGELLAEWLEPGGLVYLGGHSKGGAEAIIYAAYLRTGPGVRYPVAAVHVFGCPAPGNAAFARWYREELGKVTFSHCFGSDGIARSPWMLRLFRMYCPVGNPVYHLANGVTLFDPSPLRCLIDGVRSFSRRWAITHHSIENYLGRFPKCD